MDMEIDVKKTKITDYKLNKGIIYNIENICKTNPIHQNSKVWYSDFCEDVMMIFKDQGSIILMLLAENINIIEKFIKENNIKCDFVLLKLYGKKIKTIQKTLARPLSYSSIMAAGANDSEGMNYYIIRNDGEILTLTLNLMEALDLSGEILRVSSDRGNFDNMNKRIVDKFLLNTLNLLCKLTGKTKDEILSLNKEDK